MAPRCVDVTALADGAASAPLLDEHGGIDEPLIVVDLDGNPPPAAVAAAARVASTSDRILVGVATHRSPARVLDPLVAELDLTLAPVADRQHLVAAADPVREASTLHAAAATNPNAATVLAGLLRWSGSLSVPNALEAESLAYSTLLGGPEFRRWLDRRGPRPRPPTAAAEPVLVTRAGAQLRVTLNRPERRNAYGREVRDALVAALQVALLDDGVSHVVLDGAGACFSSGGDLDEFGTTPDLVTAHLVRTRAGAGRLLHRLAGRTEARLHGVCVGAGIELPAFAGRVVARPDTSVRLPEVGMGLIPGAGGTVSIPPRIGRWRMLYLALSGTDLDAATAREWGLVDEIR